MTALTLVDVANAAAAAEAFARETAGADDEQALRVGLATDELGANALTHGGGADTDLSLEVWFDDAFVRLSVSAAGPAFDPRPAGPQAGGPGFAEAAGGAQAGDYEPGGFGLALVHEFVDTLDWRWEDARNVTEIAIRKRAST